MGEQHPSPVGGPSSNALRVRVSASSGRHQDQLRQLRTRIKLGELSCGCVCEGSRKLGSRFAVQSLGLDEPGTDGCIPERTFKVSGGLKLVVRARATGSAISGNRQSSESDVVHDHIRPGEHQIVVVACIVVRIGAWHVEAPFAVPLRRSQGPLWRTRQALKAALAILSTGMPT